MKIHLPGEGIQFEIIEDRAHQHLLCRSCRALIHLDADILGNYPKHIEQHYHFYGVTLDLLLAGNCEKCWSTMNAFNTSV